jgi:hypothetical protein
MIVNEGGNIFKDADGVPVTQRIAQTDIKPTLVWLEHMLPGLDLRNNMLGSTGLKPTSGDIDIAVDANSVTKEQLVKRLTDWAVANNFDPRDWVRKSGVAVHFKTPIVGVPERGYVQTDFMFLNKPEFSKFILRQDPNSEYKGATRNVLLNSLAKSMGYKLNQNDGIMDRTTNELITDDPDQIAQMLLNPRATREDLGSVEKILAQLKTDPKRDAKLADFRDHMQRAGTPLDENIGYTEVNWMARLRDRIMVQGMQVITEGVRIEHPEDRVLDAGSRGLTQALQGILAAARQPETTTVKWDGKPAIIFGRKPSGEFVLTDKSGFLAKGYDGLATSPEQIEQIMAARGGERGELVAIYKKLFPLLRRTVPQDFRGYVQGDLLYAARPPVVQGAYEFQPNTVKYRVPVDSELGQQIGKSEVSVVVHTQLAAPGAAAQPITATDLVPAPGVLILDPSLRTSGEIKLDSGTVKIIQDIIAQHGRAIDKLFNPQELRDRRITDLPQLIKQYMNSRVRSGSYDDLIAGFGTWVQQQAPAKAPRIFDWATQNKTAMAAVFEAFLAVSQLKNDLVRQLDAQAQDVSASVNDEPGHEGYVGQGMKFVDRMRFSAANFARNNPELA